MHTQYSQENGTKQHNQQCSTKCTPTLKEGLSIKYKPIQLAKSKNKVHTQTKFCSFVKYETLTNEIRAQMKAHVGFSSFLTFLSFQNGLQIAHLSNTFERHITLPRHNPETT